MKKFAAGIVAAIVIAAPANALSNVASVKITHSTNANWLQIGELQAFDTGGINVALASNGGVATGSPAYAPGNEPGKANDGSTNTDYNAAPSIYHSNTTSSPFLTPSPRRRTLPA